MENNCFFLHDELQPQKAYRIMLFEVIFSQPLRRFTLIHHYIGCGTQSKWDPPSIQWLMEVSQHESQEI